MHRSGSYNELRDDYMSSEILAMANEKLMIIVAGFQWSETLETGTIGMILIN